MRDGTLRMGAAPELQDGGFSPRDGDMGLVGQEGRRRRSGSVQPPDWLV